MTKTNEPLIAEPRPASTVVLLRDTPTGLQTLLLKRNKALMFAGGLWVFPGGSIDAQDLAEAGDDLKRASRIAAAREAMEESGLEPVLDEMVQLSHWTTPVVEPKRFYTWIYAAPVASDDEVVIDGSEIHDSRWIGVSDAIRAHESGELGMLPPTYITLCDLARYDNVAQMSAGELDRVPDEVFPVFGECDGDMVVMFRGDAGYEKGDGAVSGAQHRAIFDGSKWQYMHRGVSSDYPSFVKESVA
ncbi:MAG: 8-oxo-dGTP pyrophosphatase MutT (NUDIX family) [Halioglobus sp.]|jgi:8-oxo-dGTP pyrophosphatase MutT (NUDIX family)